MIAGRCFVSSDSGACLKLDTHVVDRDMDCRLLDHALQCCHAQISVLHASALGCDANRISQAYTLIAGVGP